MIAIKITFAIIFAFILFVGAFLAIAKLIFDQVELSDHMERMKLQEVKAERSINKRRHNRRYY
ncbi:MAG: hypothetical protein ACNS60_18265 [Candidatus Cyclobacteriaceae bacterium M2_1C_046]